MKLEDVLSKHIGDLTLENIRLRMAVEAMKAELHKRDELIKKLNETEPELPMGGAVIGGSAARANNGAH